MDARTEFQIPMIANGCMFAPDCFTCPHSDCIYDPASRSHKRKQEAKKNEYAHDHGRVQSISIQA